MPPEPDPVPTQEAAASTVAPDSVLLTELGETAQLTAEVTDANGNVISLFSGAYDDVTVDTWSAEWDVADVEDVDIAGDSAKKYTNLVFAGIEFTSATVDATDKTHLRMDIWTPDETTTAAFKVKLVDFGADGVFGGDDDTEHEVTITAAEGLATEAWVQRSPEAR